MRDTVSTACAKRTGQCWRAQAVELGGITDTAARSSAPSGSRRPMVPAQLAAGRS